jgi:hypothetical protein
LPGSPSTASTRLRPEHPADLVVVGVEDDLLDGPADGVVAPHPGQVLVAVANSKFKIQN